MKTYRGFHFRPGDCMEESSFTFWPLHFPENLATNTLERRMAGSCSRYSSVGKEKGRSLSLPEIEHQSFKL
jgi:hypothetical protein